MSDEGPAPDVRYRLESEAKADELVRQASAYGEAFPDTFGGSWLAYIEEHPYAFASFVGSVDAHRARLDPRLRLVSAERSRAELETTADSVRRWIAPHAVGGYSVDVDLQHQRVDLRVAVADDEQVERELRRRFGSLVDAYFAIYVRRPMTIHRWDVLPGGCTVEADWYGDGDERDHRLEADEHDTAVHLTASSVTEFGARRAEGGPGPATFVGRTGGGPGILCRASVTLSRPVGDRVILDDQRDRMDDQPPVKRSWWWERNSDLLGERVLRWVDTLDWAEGRGCEGPHENGWIRIHATVDDIDRLRAAIEKKFGPGFEVVYKAPYRPTT